MVVTRLTTLAIDPGAAPGFAWAFSDGSAGVSEDPDAVPAVQWDEVVIEDQHLSRFLYRAGRRIAISKKAQLTLVRTAERLLVRFAPPGSPTAAHRLAPDVWRGLLWPGAGRRLPKPVVVARLIRDEPALAGLPHDVVEARGILRAWATLDPQQKKKFRVKS